MKTRPFLIPFFALALWSSTAFSKALAAEEIKTSPPVEEKTREQLSIEKEKSPTWRERLAKHRQEKRDYRLHFTEGFLAQEDKEYKKAIRAYDRAIHYNPGCAQAYHYRGYCEFQLGQVDDAIASYQMAIQMQPGIKEAYYHLGLAYVQEGRREDARAQVEKLKGMDAHLAAELNKAVDQGTGGKPATE